MHRDNLGCPPMPQMELLSALLGYYDHPTSIGAALGNTVKVTRKLVRSGLRSVPGNQLAFHGGLSEKSVQQPAHAVK